MGPSSGGLTHASVEEGKPGKSAEQAGVWPCLLPGKIRAVTSDRQVRWKGCYYILWSGSG